MYKLNLDNGKYTIEEDLNNGKFHALRYGADWRDLIGDNLILSLVNKIQELETELAAIKNENN